MATDFQNSIADAIEDRIQENPCTVRIGVVDFLMVRTFSPALSLVMMDAGDTSNQEFALKTTTARMGATEPVVDDLFTIDPSGENISVRVTEVEKSATHRGYKVRKNV